MASFIRQKFTAQSGNENSYVYKPAEGQTLLFLHGLPSTLDDWVHQLDHFSQDHGVVAMDLLGYGGSSKPTDVQKYHLKPMCDDVIELLDHLSLSQVVGVGHDFRATLLSRMAAYHPLRWSKLVFLAVGPPKLGTPFDVDMINQMTKEMLGFELLGYIPWLADDAQATLEEHVESAMSLVFCRDHEEWNKWFRPLGKMKEFVSGDSRLPIGSWYTEDLQRRHLEAFGRQDGYKGVMWYRMRKENLFAPDEVGFESFRIAQPTLLVVPEAESATQQQMLAAWAPGLGMVKVNSGHWMHLERPQETNTAIQEFLATPDASSQTYPAD